TTSAPAWALARVSAARSEPGPASARVVTWNAAGTRRRSSASSPSRARASLRTGAAGRPRPRNHFETERRRGMSNLRAEEGTRRAGDHGHGGRGPGRPSGANMRQDTSGRGTVPRNEAVSVGLAVDAVGGEPGRRPGTVDSTRADSVTSGTRPVHGGELARS